MLWLREACGAVSEVIKSLPRTWETRSAFSNGYAACFNNLNVVNVFFFSWRLIILGPDSIPWYSCLESLKSIFL